MDTLKRDAAALVKSLKDAIDLCQYESDRKRCRRYVLVDQDGGLTSVDAHGRAVQTSTVSLASARYHAREGDRVILDVLTGKEV